MRRTATRRDLALLAAAALALLVATAAFTWSRADDASSWDVPLYQSFGDRMADGAVPYRDFRIEYPPGALPAFLLPSLVAPDGDPVYEPELNDAARGTRGRSRADDPAARRDGRRHRRLARRAPGDGRPRRAALGLVGATPLLLGELALTRFDALPVALTAACVAALLHGRPRLAGSRSGSRSRPSSIRCSSCRSSRSTSAAASGRREALLSVGIAAATFAAVVLPFVALAPGEAWFSIRAQLTRGVQVESLAGNLALALGVAADKLGLGALGAGVAEGGTGEVRSADVTGTLGQVARHARRPRGGRGRRRGLARGLATAGRRRRRLVRDCAAVVAAQLALGPRALAAVRPLARPARPARRRAARPRRERAARGRARRDAVWFPDLYRDYVNERGAPETAYLLAPQRAAARRARVLAAPDGPVARSPSSPTAANRMKAGATGTA